MTIPVVIVAGYLGSGKTTLVNRILREADPATHGRLAVMVNDFGDIAIDAELIAAHEGDTIRLANGCICCTIGDLYTAFSRVLDMDPAPDALVIEASGVADPARLAALARAEPDLRCDGVVTLVDAVNVETLIADPRVGAAVRGQIEGADLLVVTKEDVASLPITLSTTLPDRPILRGDWPTRLLFDPGDAWSHEERPAPDADHEAAYDRWSFETPEALDRGALVALIERLPAAVWRFKAVSGGAESWAAHAAGRHRSVERCVPAAPGTRMVAIAPKGLLDRAALDALARTLTGEPA